MTHLTDDDLVLYFYAEGEALPGSLAHLEACVVCRERLDELERTMSAVSASRVPERDESYGRVVWARVQAQLDQPEPSRWRGWLSLEWLTRPRLAYAGGLAVLLVAAFVAGRNWPAPRDSQPAEMVAATASRSTEAEAHRMLLESVTGHLERSAMVLTEVANVRTAGAMDLSEEQSRAGDLVASNRLMRQTATRAGDAGLADVLEQLERVLLEITNSPSPMPQGTLDAIRTRIESDGLLFKVRVLESQVRVRRDADPASPPATKKS